MTDIYLNHKFVGNVDNAQEFVEQVRQERRRNSINQNLNILHDKELDEIRLQSSKGRARRPLIVIKDGQALLSEGYIRQIENDELSWNDLVKQGVIEFLDAMEEENSYVALTPEDITTEHTHLEITPMAILGLCSSLVPFGNFNHGVRVTQGSKNQKQAIGFYASNFAVRMDTDVNLLHYPQLPLVQTAMHEVSDYEKHPFGQNIVIAIMSYEGYNMEDAIVINKGSIERGLARSTYYRPSLTEELRYAGGLVDEIAMPDKDVKGYKTEHDYRFLEEDGMISPEAKVRENDVLIGKTSPPRFLSSLDEYSLTTATRRESSVSMKHGEEGVVDFILLSENEEGNKLVQIRLRDQRIPEVGDKFTSRHGQKGVISLIVPQDDMPFTASGITPDLIFSPHGVPSRMTVSHLLELIGGKVGALDGRFIDGSAFDSESEAGLRQQLHELGFRENGVETVYDGITGNQYNARLYVGNMYYLKLKHMVANKIHSRARGPIQLLTRQPTEGRAKEGGLRLGEMEKDTFVAHGASLVLKERFDSDKTKVPICESCGLLAIHDEFKNKSYCNICGDNVEISSVEISYAFKLIMDEFKCLGIYPKMKLSNKF